jgi:beta-N-acetylglucosaminidase
MKFETGRENVGHQVAHRVTWFAPDRPVDGGTLFIRPEFDNSADVAEENSGTPVSE